MKYQNITVRPNKRQVPRKVIIGLAIALMLCGAYLLYLVLVAPKIVPGSNATIINPEQPPERQLIIPKIGVNAPIVADDLTKLDEGKIVQRTGSGGNPEAAGNFVLTGHRFMMDYTPKRVQEKSVLYNLNKLVVGDEITVYWDKKPFLYKVTKKHEVKPDQIEVEAPTQETKLTLYTCTLGGSYDGRLVIEATPQQNSPNDEN